jgi:rSAM/selenodomain-associated transferase 1
MTTDSTARPAIAILAKAPLPGLAKTRLMPLLGAAGAAALQGWLLRRTVATALAAELGPVTLWCTPDIDHAAFAACRTLGPLVLRQQVDGDLGARMLAAVAANTGGGTLVIGTDCPRLDRERLRQAAASLATHDASLIPAEDGGYVLIGLRRAAPAVFAGVDWSTPQVMAQTRQRLHALGWRWHELAPLWDVDHPADFARLLATLPEAAGLAPAAAAAGDDAGKTGSTAASSASTIWPRPAQA